ncbi:MAG: acyl-ACP--UDP-N-acetylglucosamine O-acyltransferase, partial [Planctomycetota bacterium]
MCASAIHPTAIIDPQAEIDPTAEIGPYSVVGPDVKLGPGVSIGPNSVITGWTELEEGVRVWPFAAVGHAPQDLGYKGARSFVRVGARTQLREGVTVHRGTGEDSWTVIGADCLMMNNAHVAHNCTVGDSVILASGVLLAGHVSVGDRAFISGNAAVHQFCRVGRLAM